MMDLMARHRLAQAVGDMAYEAVMREGNQRKAAERYYTAYTGMMKSLQDINERMENNEREADTQAWLNRQVAMVDA